MCPRSVGRCAMGKRCAPCGTSLAFPRHEERVGAGTLVQEPDGIGVVVYDCGAMGRMSLPGQRPGPGALHLWETPRLRCARMAGGAGP